MSLHVTVVAADHSVWSGPAKSVVARTTEGEIGLRAGHEPLLAVLADGEVRVFTPEGEKIVVRADGGFLSVDSDEVSVVAHQAQLAG